MGDPYIDKKIYYHDTDAGGVVYYASYLKHLEEGRSEYCLKKGVDLVKWASEGVIFPVVHLEVDYKSPARYGDTVRISTVVDKVGRCSVYFSQEIKKGNAVLVKARTVWACVDKFMKPQSVPVQMQQFMKK